MPRKFVLVPDYGVAISTDNGNTWAHKMLENTSPLWSNDIVGQNSVLSILALPDNRVIALSRTGVYLTNESVQDGKSWPGIELGMEIFHFRKVVRISMFRL